MPDNPITIEPDTPSKTPPKPPPNGLDRDRGAAAEFELPGVELVRYVDQPDQETIPDEETINTEIARLARLPPIRYAHQRRLAMETLHCPLTYLDRAVNAERQKYADTDITEGRPIVLFEPEPWPEPVAGAVLLDELTAAILDYVIIEVVYAWAVALWILFDHAFELADFAPKLHITSATMRSGKTRLLRVISHLVTRPKRTSNITPAALYRLIDKERPTLLMDEGDTFMHDNEELRGIINGGFDRGETITRSVQIGDRWEARDFSIWCPQVIAGIGKLAGTIGDRSFQIRLKRKLKSETVKRLRQRDSEPLLILARKCTRWVHDNKDRIAAIDEPAIPPEIDDRLADAWRLSMAIAEVAGTGWPERAQEAARILAGARDQDEDATGVKLLGDIRELFDPLPTAENPDARPVEVLFSHDIVDALIKREDRNWAAYGRPPKPISQNQIARLLKAFEIPTNKTVRRADETDKGYRREWFDDAFARYLPDR